MPKKASWAKQQRQVYSSNHTYKSDNLWEKISGCIGDFGAADALQAILTVVKAKICLIKIYVPILTSKLINLVAKKELQLRRALLQECNVGFQLSK